jgi:hypothetical protein
MHCPIVRHRHRAASCLATASASVLLAWPSPPAHADTKTWVGSAGGSWNLSTNWSPVGVPANNDTVVINPTVTTTYNITYNFDYLAGAGIDAFTLNSTGSTPVSFNQTLASSNLLATNETICDTGHATNLHSASNNSRSGTLTLGNAAGSTGSYSLSGTGSLSASNTHIGYNGVGSFSHSAATHTDTSHFLADNAGSTGSYSLSGTGSLSVNFTEYVALTGTGSFTQSAGTHTVSNFLFLAYNAGSTGSYSLSGTGSLSTNKIIFGHSAKATSTHSA